MICSGIMEISYNICCDTVQKTLGEHNCTIHRSSGASIVMSDFAAFARWRGDSKLWKPLLTQFCFAEAHRNGSCNESKTDMLAGAATGANVPASVISRHPRKNMFLTESA